MLTTSRRLPRRPWPWSSGPWCCWASACASRQLATGVFAGEEDDDELTPDHPRRALQRPRDTANRLARDPRNPRGGRAVLALDCTGRRPPPRHPARRRLDRGPAALL